MNTEVSLFEAAQTLRETLYATDAETGELSDAYSHSRELFERKGAACIMYALEEQASIEAAEQLLKHMAATVAARAARLDRFRSYIADCMKAAGVAKVSAAGVASASLYIGRDESVELDDGTTFPPELCADPKPPAPSKARIKAAILAGEPVAGARIVRRDRLTIK